MLGSTEVLRKSLRPIVGFSREVALSQAVSSVEKIMGPLVVFLPSAGKSGSALLRIYNIAKALPKHGWRTFVVPAHMNLHQRRKLLERLKPSVVVMHGVRHSLNRPFLYSGLPIVMDIDDADFHLPHLVGPLQRGMPFVTHVIAGSEYIADWCRANGSKQASVVWTGSPVSRGPRPSHQRRRNVIAWAQSRPMNYSDEAKFVRNVVTMIGAQLPGVTFRLYDKRPGDPIGFMKSFEADGVTVEWNKACKYSDYLRSFRDVALGFAPLSTNIPFSQGKSFGKILAYLDSNVPVFASDVGEHARFFKAGLGVVSNSQNVWVLEALRLLSDAKLRDSIADAAFWSFEERLSLESSASRTDQVLRDVVASHRMSKIANQ